MVAGRIDQFAGRTSWQSQIVMNIRRLVYCVNLLIVGFDINEFCDIKLLRFAHCILSNVRKPCVFALAALRNVMDQND